MIYLTTNNTYKYKIIIYIYIFGKRESAETLNKTLLKLITLLNDNNIEKWFVCYGTLLGMVRENSCIDGDDDIDIITDKNNYDIIKEILKENNIQVYTGGYNERCFHPTIKKRIKQKKIIKTKPTSEHASIDIYMGDFKDGNVYDMWNCLTIKDCFLDKEKETFIEHTWNGQKINPNNYERILVSRYGKSWNKKIDQKIPQTMKEL